MTKKIINNNNNNNYYIDRDRRRCKRPKYAEPFSVDCRDRGSHARGVYPTQDTSRLGTAREKK